MHLRHFVHNISQYMYCVFHSAISLHAGSQVVSQSLQWITWWRHRFSCDDGLSYGSFPRSEIVEVILLHISKFPIIGLCSLAFLLVKSMFVCLSLLLLLQQSILTFTCRDTVPHNVAVYHVGSFFFKLITAYCLIYKGYLHVNFISKLLNLLNCQEFFCYTDYIPCMQMLLQFLSLILMQLVVFAISPSVFSPLSSTVEQAGISDLCLCWKCLH